MTWPHTAHTHRHASACPEETDVLVSRPMNSFPYYGAQLACHLLCEAFRDSLLAGRIFYSLPGSPCACIRVLLTRCIINTEGLSDTRSHAHHLIKPTSRISKG